MSTYEILHNKKSMSFMASFVIHAVVFAMGLFFVKPIQYAVELGTGGVEVILTAAPAEVTSIEPAAVKQAEKPVIKEIIKDPDDMVLPQNDIEEEKIQPKAEVKEPPKQVQTAMNSEFKGDGSSAIIGKDKTTFYSAGGAIAEAKPNYLKNPAPVYPWEARQAGWQGVVILKVFVDKSGHAVEVEKEQTSGFDVLDQSALKTVRSWRFQPAQMAGLPVDSYVRIPIRFELNKS